MKTMLGGFADGRAPPVPARIANPTIPAAAPRSRSRRVIWAFSPNPIEPPLTLMKNFYLGVLHLRFTHPAVCTPSGRSFLHLRGRECTASSGHSHRTDKSASWEDPSHPPRTPLTPYLPRHPSRRWPPDFPFERARGIPPRPAHSSHS